MKTGESERQLWEEERKNATGGKRMLWMTEKMRYGSYSVSVTGGRERERERKLWGKNAYENY